MSPEYSKTERLIAEVAAVIVVTLICGTAFYVFWRS